MRANALELSGSSSLTFASAGVAAITGDISIDGSLTFAQDNGVDATVANTVVGSGAVVKSGAGTITLTGTNTYTGGTTITGGTLQIGDGGTTGSITGNVVNNGTLAFDRSDVITFGGIISGTGGVTQAGTGTTILTGASTYTGGTTIASGTLQIGAGGTTGSITGNVANSGTLAFDRSDTITFGGIISGTGGVTQAGTGATILTGASTYTGGTTIASGTLQIGAGGTTGSIVGNVANDGTLAFDRSDTITFGGVISGTGGVTQAGTGTTILTGTSTYTGGTTITGGTLQIGDGGTTGAIAGNVANSGTLAFDRSDTMTFAGIISGTGTVDQIGTGTTILTGTSTYTGGTTVSAGALIVDGSIATSSGLTVDAGGLVGGSGTLPSATISGTLAPGTGTGIGTLTVAGNLAFTTGSTYRIDVSPSSSDLTSVTGTATLAGTVSALFQAGTYVTRNYVILSAAGGLGGTTFDGLTTNLPAGFLSSLSYTSTDVLLNLTAALGAGQGLAVNQQAVAGALNGWFNNGGALPPAFATVFGLGGAPLGAALTQLSGEPATGAQTAALQSTQSFLNLMLDPFVAGRGAAPSGPALAFAGEPTGPLPSEAARAYAKAMPGVYTKAPPAPVYAPRWTIWGAAYGGRATVDGNAVIGSHDLDSRAWGIAAGADWRVSPETLLGFALAGGGTRWATGSLGDGRSDVFQAGLYGSHHAGPAFVSAALAYAWHDATTTRNVTVAGPETLEGRFHPQVFGARLETGWRLGGPTLGLTPYAAGQVQAFRMSGFAETATFGPGTFALSYAEETVTVPRTELGTWADTRFLAGSGELILRARAAWAHDFETNRTLTPTFQALPGAGFVVTGATADADLALLSAAAEWRLGRGVALIAKADGELGGSTRSLAGTGTLRVTW